MLRFTDPAKGFTTPLGDNEVVRIIITDHGKKVVKHSAMGGTLFGVGLMFVLNRYYGGSNNGNLRNQAADAAKTAAEAAQEAAEKAKK